MKQESGNVLKERVLKSSVAAEMRNMLLTAVDTGTGKLAKIRYSVAGKTGTVRKSPEAGIWRPAYNDFRRNISSYSDQNCRCSSDR